MNSTEFVEDQDLNSTVKTILEESSSPALKPIIENDITILPVLKIKTNKDGEHVANSGPPAKLIKVSGMWSLFVKAHYIMVVDYYAFHHSGNRNALIFNALCSADVESVESTLKIGIKKPDVSVFAATIAEFGAFDDVLLAVRDVMNSVKSKASSKFLESVATGKLEDVEPDEPDEEEEEEEEKPRVVAGYIESGDEDEDEDEKPSKRKVRR